MSDAKVVAVVVVRNGDGIELTEIGEELTELYRTRRWDRFVERAIATGKSVVLANTVGRTSRRERWVAVGSGAKKVLERLLAGEAVQAGGHRIEYDEGNLMTWYTNAYGLDGILCDGKPTLEVVTRFLADMAAGVDYGMTPD